MPANTNPIFVLTPNRGVNGGVRITGVNTTRDLSSTGNTFVIFSAGTNGSRIDAIDWVHSSTGQTGTDRISVAAVGRLFQCTDINYSNPKLIREQTLTATTSSTTALGSFQTTIFTTPLVLPPGYILVATMSVAQNSGGYFDVTVYGGDY